MKKINKKIPGVLTPPPKTEIDGKITDLSSKTIPELLELKDRQEKLLNNKSFISKLADKGAKIQAFRDKIAAVLILKQDHERTCQLFAKLELNKKFVQDIEWNRKTEQRNEDTYLDSDDDSDPEDVMHILSQNTAQEKKITTVEPEKPLITSQDLINIGEQPYIKHIVDITEHRKPKVKGQFKPYKTTFSNVHDPEKEILRKKHKHWEVTAATPPPIVHGPAKVLSIEESLNLQKEYNTHLKEVEAQHAAEKLLSRTNVKMAKLPEDTSKFGKYRDIDSDDESESKSDESDDDYDKNIFIEEIAREGGGVMFTVMDLRNEF